MTQADAGCTPVCTSAAEIAHAPPLDADLRVVVELWPKLSADARTAVAQLVKATAANPTS